MPETPIGQTAVIKCPFYTLRLVEEGKHAKITSKKFFEFLFDFFFKNDAYSSRVLDFFPRFTDRGLNSMSRIALISIQATEWIRVIMIPMEIVSIFGQIMIFAVFMITTKGLPKIH